MRAAIINLLRSRSQSPSTQIVANIGSITVKSTHDPLSLPMLQNCTPILNDGSLSFHHFFHHSQERIPNVTTLFNLLFKDNITTSHSTEVPLHMEHIRIRVFGHNPLKHQTIRQVQTVSHNTIKMFLHTATNECLYYVPGAHYDFNVTSFISDEYSLPPNSAMPICLHYEEEKTYSYEFDREWVVGLSIVSRWDRSKIDPVSMQPFPHATPKVSYRFRLMFESSRETLDEGALISVARTFYTLMLKVCRLTKTPTR